MQEQEQIELIGTVEDVVFRRGDSGFTVIDLNTADELVTVVGVLPEIAAGEELRLLGHWDFHASFGRQFKAEFCERSLPSTAADLLKYLSSGVIKGIGPATAVKIIDAFGEDTFHVLENEPERLANIKGISNHKAKKISDEFKRQFSVREVMIALEGFRMSPSECIEAFKLFGADAVNRITENPYILCTSQIGLGFERADAIARALPKSPDFNYRIRAGIVYVVSYNLSNGHTCIPREKLIVPCTKLLDTDDDTIEIALDALIEDKQLIRVNIAGKDFIFLPEIYIAERHAAQRVAVMLNFPPAGKPTLESEIAKIELESGIRYEEKQRLAIVTAIQRGMLVLTGGPGTGKTTTLNAILKLFENDGLEVALAAPTGRAAKRMSEVTGHEAKTIHRLLEVEWDGSDRPRFARNARNPLTADALIIDELSMVDISLFSALMDALPLGCRFIMVGDYDQLPPVGAGNVLHDLIESGLLPVVQLTEVFRQAMKSLIVTNAHRIVQGEMPLLDRVDNDFFYMERGSTFHVARTIKELCTTRLPNAYGYSPILDIQVLCPTRKGDAGTVNLNRVLQEALNPADNFLNEINLNGRVFREGDKVMQIKNNYNILWTREKEQGSGIFNGDVGFLKEIDLRSSTMTILFEDRVAYYPFDNANELELAYAMTVHKSQGSEFEAVIMPIIDVAPQLAYRNLLYTAVTRAKSMMILVGSSGQIAKMVANDRKARRYSALQAFLTEES